MTEQKPWLRQPVDQIIWVHREYLHPNEYNPNRVAPPEMELLKTSIKEEGWLFPIIVITHPDENKPNHFRIVDGFHRWTVSGDPEIYALTKGYVPVIVVPSENTERLMMTTIRMNRAKGTHGVTEMANIVQGMIESGIPIEEIMERLSMEEDEIKRLANRNGIPLTDIITNSEFSKAWEPDTEDENEKKDKVDK